MGETFVVCEYAGVGGGFAGGSLERSAKKAEYPGVRWNKQER